MSERADTVVLFPNDRKQADNHPDLKGRAKISGIAYWADAWNKTDRNGQAYISVALKRVEATSIGRR